MPSTEEFKVAFKSLLENSSKEIENGFAMLKANYRAPDKQISAERLAKAAGYSSYTTGNQQYGAFAHQVADLLEYQPDIKVRGETRWTPTLCIESTVSDQSGHFQWILRPEVALALEEMGLVEPIEFSDALSDIEAASAIFQELSEKSRDAFVKARIGQGLFRDRLIRYWQACAVTGFEEVILLVASHIKPWRKCTFAEALDMPNGLLLTPNIDSCFDKGFISFDVDGKIIFSPQLSSAVASQLGLNQDMKLRHILSFHQPYLKHHRENEFLSKS
nr:HNH endonuclease [uncultured Albidiferax sp.]